MAHGARTLKTVTFICHATESTVFGASTAAARLQSHISLVVINEVFHLDPLWAVVHDAARACGGSALSLPLVYLCVGDAGAGVLARCDVGFYGTNSLRYPPILLIYHVSVQTIAGS